MLVAIVTSLLLAAGCQGTPVARHEEIIAPQISGGSEIDIQRVPYQVSLERQSSHICGGAVLTDSWVLTAAHCVLTDQVDPSALQIRVGSSVREEGGSLYSVHQVKIPSQFIEATPSYDVALLQTRAPIDTTPSVQPVSLVPKGASPKGGQKFIASGWGKLNVGEFFLARYLNALSVRLVAHRLCELAYKNTWQVVDSSMICAEATRRSTGVCVGDEGGPLVDDMGRLAGVISWGRGCGSPNYPYVYANLADSLINDWIVSTAV